MKANLEREQSDSEHSTRFVGTTQVYLPRDWFLPPLVKSLSMVNMYGRQVMMLQDPLEVQDYRSQTTDLGIIRQIKGGRISDGDRILAGMLSRVISNPAHVVLGVNTEIVMNGYIPLEEGKVTVSEVFLYPPQEPLGESKPLLSAIRGTTLDLFMPSRVNFLREVQDSNGVNWILAVTTRGNTYSTEPLPVDEIDERSESFRSFLVGDTVQEIIGKDQDLLEDLGIAFAEFGLIALQDELVRHSKRVVLNRLFPRDY